MVVRFLAFDGFSEEISPRERPPPQFPLPPTHNANGDPLQWAQLVLLSGLGSEHRSGCHGGDISRHMCPETSPGPSMPVPGMVERNQ
jgi:hypothetical protein